ncbi:MAG: sulfotransferase, partial [Candidatus Binatus sp.]|nr:sulfotransferase [Candidatus Binatus sp.]
ALGGHVGLPANVKEIHFFNNHYEKGLDWYLSHFRRCEPELPMGEVCNYFAFPRARERIQSHMPACKIVVSLRDPVDRTYSAYKLNRCQGFTKTGFDEFAAARADSRAGKYAPHLADWFARFGRERVLVTFYDELRKDQQTYFDQICDFLLIARVPLADARNLHEAVNSFATLPRSHRLAQNARHLRNDLKDRRFYRTNNMLERLGVWRFCFSGGDPFPALTPEQDAGARTKFLPEIEALEELLGRDLSAWKVPRAGRVVDERTAAVVTGSDRSLRNVRLTVD